MIGSPLLSIDGLTVDYSRRGGSPAVSDLDLTVASGAMTAVVGESGSGKSTTANAVIGLLPSSARITTGRIRLGDLDRTGLGPTGWRGVRGSRIGYVPQDPGTSLNPLQTTGRSVAEALRIHRRMNRTEARARVIELLGRVGIDRPEKRADQFPHELSGGMRQRVLIAAAIALRPRLLIADEPTSALDVTVQKQVLDLLDELRDETGMGILFITHDLAVAGERADEVLVMQSGSVVEAGEAERVFSHPATEYTSRLLADAPALQTKPRRCLAEAAADSQHPFVSVDSLTQVFDRTENQVIGVEDVSFTIGRGTTHGIVGESGSGKTTTGRALAGFLAPQSGRLRIGDFDAAEFAGSGPGGRRRRARPSRARLRQFRATVQLVHQNPYSALDPKHSIRSTLTEPLRNFGIGTRSSRAGLVHEILERVALPAEFLDRRPAELSGGQLQRVAIARALIVEPELIVFDEAVSALDVTVQAQILSLLDRLQRELGLTYVFITHDLAVVRQIADTVSVMSRGHLVESGETEEIFAHPSTDRTRALLDAIPNPVTLTGHADPAPEPALTAAAES